ncbi:MULTISPECIES: hypothetical protein [Mycobacteriaceae]|uniref:hypothetical protein n=1 Tax=Mycobacteriaceae TaxID=1762 RepID=UPI000268227D|nr:MULTISPECIES: hypothetical protein [Mycobacteriaceae]EIU51586.1 hypothetical protein MA6G0125S_5298 [Mycobacteroides abscessus 6G-0125-S]EIU64295.1 hypothetical protein MA6G0728S_5436 [Mycobacteroides abscessus 6G-0728-S]EIU74676.1 hypothetical protein MA6G1108_5300 [Mycobacteroides abscessus 6G-1108]EIV03160.1 hypothetical protein MA6G0728R_5464 [Mycobacteroides abscessus 6G-0728-R]
MAYHPAVEEWLAKSQRLGEAIGAVQDAAFNNLRVRRAAPSDPDVMPEVDGWGTVTDVYLGEGVTQRYSASQLGEVIMAGLRECYAVLNDRRKEAAREAAPELDTELWFGSAETTTAAADGSDDHNGSAERSRA